MLSQKKSGKRSTEAIEANLNKEQFLFDEADDEIKKLAKHYADLIIQNRLSKKAAENENTKKQPIEAQTPVYEKVDVNSTKNSNARTIGIEHIAVSQMREYGLFKFFEKLGFNENSINNAAGLIAGKLAHPASERETARWLRCK